MSLITPQELWNELGKDAFVKVRNEIVATGDGSTSIFNLDHDNVITSSDTLYTDGTSVSTASYTIDLDEGKITGFTAGSNVTLSADYNYGDIDNTTIQSILDKTDADIENKTGRTFVKATGTIEFIDVETGDTDFFLKNFPAITLSEVAINQNAVTDDPSWLVLTEGLGNGYLANSQNLEDGRIRIINNKPIAGKDRIRVTYDHGYEDADIPEIVKELAVLKAQWRMSKSAIYKAIFKGFDNFTPVKLAELKADIEDIEARLRNNNYDRI